MTTQEKLDYAIDYLKKQDLAGMAVGKYPVNDWFYFSIQEYDSKLIENCKLESHKNYADVQIVLAGEEAIDIVPVQGLELAVEYNPEKDVMFWKIPSVMARTELRGGSFATYLPDVAHRPGIAIGNKPVHVKKCVGKVRVN